MRQCLWEELKVQFSGTGGEGCFVTFLHSHAGTHPSPKVPENVSKFGCGAAPRGAMWVGAETAKQEWQPAESCCRRCGKEKQAGGLKFWVQMKARLSQKFCISTGAQEPSWVNAVPRLAPGWGRLSSQNALILMEQWLGTYPCSTITEDFMRLN